MKKIPNVFVVKFSENPQGGRPIARYNGIIVMPEREVGENGYVWWSPPLGKEVSVKPRSLPSGRSGVIYVDPLTAPAGGPQ